MPQSPSFDDLNQIGYEETQLTQEDVYEYPLSTLQVEAVDFPKVRVFGRVKNTGVFIQFIETSEYTLANIGETTTVTFIDVAFNVFGININDYESFTVKEIADEPEEVVDYTTIRALKIEQLQLDQKNAVDNLKFLYNILSSRVLKFPTSAITSKEVIVPAPLHDTFFVYDETDGWILKTFDNLEDNFTELIAKLKQDLNNHVEEINKPELDRYVEEVSEPSIDEYVEDTLNKQTLYFIQGSAKEYSGSNPSGIADIVDQFGLPQTEILNDVAPLTSRPNENLEGTTFIATEDFDATINGNLEEVKTGDFISWFGGNWFLKKVLNNETFNFNTVSEMVSANYLVDGDKIQLWGYNNLFDGASHKRIKSSFNNGTGIPLESGGFAILEDGVETNVKWFGAVGNGVADDTIPLNLACSRGGLISFGKNETYLVNNEIIINDKTTVELNGSTINLVTELQNPCFRVLGDCVTITNGTITVVGSTMGGNGHSLACITAGLQSTGEGFKKLNFTNLTLSTNRNDAGATISIIGECSNILIENIVIPDNPNCRNVIGCEWGGLPVPNGTGHPHDITIRNIRIGRLTYPTYGNSGFAYAVWLSSAFNVKVENVSMIEGYGLIMAIRGDNANTYAPSSYKDLVGTGITVNNVSIANCFGYGVRVVGSHLSETLDNIPMNVNFKNVTVKGKKIDSNNNFGFQAEQSSGVSLDNFKFYGEITAGITTGVNNDKLVIKNGEILNSEIYGASIGNSARFCTIENVSFVGNNRLEGTGVGTSALFFGDAILPNIKNCKFGEFGSITETQKYAIRISPETVRPKLNDNHVYSIATGGFAYFIGDLSTDYNILATGENNTSEAGITNAGSLIFNIDKWGNKTSRADVVPTTGEWSSGDIIYRTPSFAGNFIGWVCTSSGSPGVWKTFGQISS